MKKRIKEQAVSEMLSEKSGTYQDHHSLRKLIKQVRLIVFSTTDKEVWVSVPDLTVH